ncbi:MAG: hypothetical protein FD138_3004 [Planctomycetota bacterium]|nr:MAG: hypothetical protein FD138_3004 [Planctomycetota bacterium]
MSRCDERVNVAITLPRDEPNDQTASLNEQLQTRLSARLVTRSDDGYVHGSASYWPHGSGIDGLRA